jgi:EpsI family protein
MLIRSLIVAVALIAGALGIGRASDAEPVGPPIALAGLPLAMGGWSGTPLASFDARTLSVLGVDDYVFRSYSAGPGAHAGLYVGFYRSQRQGDTMHSPLNCLPGSGWQPVEKTRRSIVVASSIGGPPRQIEVNELIIERGLERQVVFYWYQSRERVVASEYWGKIWTVVDAVRQNRTDGALVRVTVPFTNDPGPARERGVAFITSLYPLLKTHLPS